MSDNPSANKKAEEVSEDSQTAEVVETSTTITSAVDEEATEDDNETETLTVNTDTVSEVNTASLATSLVQSTAKKVTSTQTQKSLVEASVSGNTLSIQYNGIITAGESLKLRFGLTIMTKMIWFGMMQMLLVRLISIYQIIKITVFTIFTPILSKMVKLLV